MKPLHSPFKTIMIALVATIFMVLFSNCKSALMQANKYHYLATKHASNGKLKKAKRNLLRAIKLNPVNAYYIDVVNLSLEQGNKKQAMKFISKLECGDDCTPEEEASLMVWKGIFALNLSQRKDAIRLLSQALGKICLLYTSPSPRD